MGSTGSREVAGLPVVLIIGGGVAGIAVAKELDATAKFNVVLIDRKDYFLHNIAGLRAAVEKDWAERILIPYNKLLKHGTVVHGDVLEVGPEGVLVNGRDEPVPFDYLVLATGSSYAFPGKIAAATKEEAIEKYHELADLLKEKEKILIIGGGPVGVELAGEISENYPDKEITLVHSQSQLIGSGLKQTFFDKVEEQLRRRGVNLVLGERVDTSTDDLKDEIKASSQYYINGNRTVKTDKGTEIEADIIFVCTGTITNNKTFLTHFSDLLDTDGRIKVNSHFQVEGHDNIFALGDCCNMEARMAFLAGKHAPVVVKNIQTLENNKSASKEKELQEYTPAPYPAMFVSIGKTGGVGQMPMKSGMVVGATLTSMMKSKTLFVGKSWSAQNQKLKWDEPSPDTELSGQEVKTKNLAAALGVSEKEAKKMLKSSLPQLERDEGEERT